MFSVLKMTETTTETTTYDFETMMTFNHPDLSNIDLHMIDFFSKLPVYPITKEIRFHYPNKFNYHFNKRKVRPQTIISSDPEILKRLRSNLSKLSEQNIDTITENIKQLLGHGHHDWKQIADLFYVITIDNVNSKETLLTSIYVKLLVKLEKYYHFLLHYLHQKIKNQVYHPHSFTDTFSESGKDKEKRWRISNCLLILEIFHQGKYKKEFLQEVLNHIASQISYENTLPLEVFVIVLRKMKPGEIPDEISKKLMETAEDKNYPARLRLLLDLPKIDHKTVNKNQYYRVK